MSGPSFLRQFSSSLQDPDPQTTDDSSTPSPSDSVPVLASPPPAQQVDYAPPQPEPFRKDPLVGPGMPVDPKDHVVHTPDLPMDLDALRKMVKDPLGTSKSGQDPSGPTAGGPPPGSSPPGPGYTWDPVLPGWKKIKDPDPSLPLPPAPDPPAKGDYESPDDNSAPA